MVRRVTPWERPVASSLSGSDIVPVYQNSSDQAAQGSLDAIAAWVADNLGVVTVRQAGLAADASTDDAAAMTSLAAWCDDQGYVLDGLGLTVAVRSATRIPRNLRNVKIVGPTVTGSFTGATGINEKAIVYTLGEDIWDAARPTAAVTSSVSRGDQDADVSGMDFEAGEVVLLHEATNWGANSTCYKSEVLTVKSYTSGNVVFTSKIEGSYSTSATIRKYGTEDVYLSNVKISGGGTGLDQTGLLVLNCRSVALDNVWVEDCARRGGDVVNCASVTGTVLRADRCDRDGFGYGWQFSGSSNVTVAAVQGSQCRHVITAGGGVQGRQLARKWQFGSVLGTGCYDAVWDSHPGVVDVQIGSIMGTCDPSFSSNEGFMFQGSRLQVGSITLVGFTDNGARIQYFGDGDGAEPVFYIGSIHIPNSAATLAAFTYEDDNATGGTWPVSSIHIGHLDGTSQRGSRIRAVQQTVRRVTIGGGRSEGTTSAYDGLLLNSASPGAIIDASILGMTLATVSGGAGDAFQAVGHASNVINVLLSGCRFKGGRYGVQATQATVALNRPTFESPSSANTNAGTGGTIVTATYA